VAANVSQATEALPVDSSVFPNTQMAEPIL
jgi:hypothetical protein